MVNSKRSILIILNGLIDYFTMNYVTKIYYKCEKPVSNSLKGSLIDETHTSLLKYKFYNNFLGINMKIHLLFVIVVIVAFTTCM